MATDTARKLECPQCHGPLERVSYPGGYLNRDQWESNRAGDYVCRTCPGEGHTSRHGWCYWWESELEPVHDYQI